MIKLNEERDFEIIQTRKKGAAYQEIADQFGLSRERLCQICLRFVLEEKIKLQSEEIRNVIKLADDIEIKWQKGFLLDGLNLPIKTAWALNKYFNRNNISQFSLKGLMDFNILKHDFSSENILSNMPALKEKWIGRKTYSDFINYLSEHDLGHSFNTEWEKRVKKLEQYFTKK